jgi:hypothetical protein
MDNRLFGRDAINADVEEAADNRAEDENEEELHEWATGFSDRRTRMNDARDHERQQTARHG